VVRVPPRSKTYAPAVTRRTRIVHNSFALCRVTPGHTFPFGVAALHFNQLIEIKIFKESTKRHLWISNLLSRRT